VSNRNTNYHMWTSYEIEKVHNHIKLHRHPTGSIPITALSTDLGLPYHSVRGAVIREMQNVKKVDTL